MDFPSIPHNKLWLKLYNLGIPAKIIRTLQNIYTNGKTRIKLENGLSKELDVTEGVMQGEILSPLLFSLYISDIERTLQESKISGIKLENYVLHILLFADDMVLLAQSCDVMEDIDQPRRHIK